MKIRQTTNSQSQSNATFIIQNKNNLEVKKMNLSQSLEDLQEDLKCPVCLKIPRSIPIYQCMSGHIYQFFTLFQILFKLNFEHQKKFISA